MIYRVHISSAARWVLNLRSSSIEFVLLSVSENRADWVCGVQEGFKPTTMKKKKSFSLEVVTVVNCFLWCWHHQRQIVLFSRTLSQTMAAGDGIEICCCFIYISYFFFFFPTLNRQPSIRQKALRSVMCKSRSADMHVGFLGCLSPPQPQESGK